MVRFPVAKSLLYLIGKNLTGGQLPHVLWRWPADLLSQKKRKERPMTHLSSKISTRFELASLTSLHIVNALSNLKNGLTYVLFVFFNINLHEIEGRHANAKAHDAIDHLASILSSREEIS